jgi:hypothetical protein
LARELTWENHRVFSIYYFGKGNTVEMRWAKIDRNDIFRAIELERERQDKLHPLPKRKNFDEADIDAVQYMIMTNEFLAVLVEEVGEVASALQGDGDLKDELIHVASVCVRFLEQLK